MIDYIDLELAILRLDYSCMKCRHCIYLRKIGKYKINSHVI